MSLRSHAPLRYDPQAVFAASNGLTRQQLEADRPRLLAARARVLHDAELWAGKQRPPEPEGDFDAGFHELPERLLREFEQQGARSEVARIQATARRLAEQIDRLVVLGIGGSYMGARALFEACCHPYFNELPRAARGGWPRLYFEGNNLDNDALLGLVDLLRSGDPLATVDDRWGIVVISKSGATLETAAAFRWLLAELRKACGGRDAELASLVVPVTGEQGKLCELSAALGCPETFPIPDGVGGRFSIFSAVGLLPAALLGLDIVALLEGAAQMNAQFRNAPPGENPVLDYVAVCHALERERGQHLRILSTWGKGLEAAGFWYDQLLSESLGKHEQGATPITVVNTRDLHSRGQQHQEGRRDKLITNVRVAQPKRAPLALGRSMHDQDDLNRMAEKKLPELLEAAITGTNQAYAEAGRPTADLWLPRLDEATLGQFFQMLMLATVVEGRLIGVNPYGQPGVEFYKRHMNEILRKG